MRRKKDARGVVIAFLGIDGVGKSTLIQRLQEISRKDSSSVKVFHFMPALLSKGKSIDVVASPHSKSPRSLLLSLVKLAYYWFNYTLGYWIKVRPALAMSTWVFFDRYYNDLLIDPRRYRYGGPMELAWLLGRFIPAPDLFIFLDLPAEVAHARKPEVPLDEAKKLRKRYLELASSLPNAHVVEASKPLEEVVAVVEQIILNYTSGRTARRLGLKR